MDFFTDEKDIDLDKLFYRDSVDMFSCCEFWERDYGWLVTVGTTGHVSAKGTTKILAFYNLLVETKIIRKP